MTTKEAVVAAGLEAAIVKRAVTASEVRIAQATGENTLRKSLQHIKPDHQIELDVLALIAKRTP